MVKLDVELIISNIALVEAKYNSLTESEQKAFYLATRVAYNAQPREGADQAVNFLLLNKAGFNGLYRENSKGAFNVPFGQRKSLFLGQAENIRNVSQALQATEIRLTAYQEAVSGAEAGDLVYFDPPYVPLSVTSAFTRRETADGGFQNPAVQPTG
jgi:DNA adenine methylase